MGFSRDDRRAINTLSDVQRSWFDILAGAEKGLLETIPELCFALSTPIIPLLAFSCLSGDGNKQELELGLGSLFTERKINALRHLQNQLKKKACPIFPVVIFDDCEPKRVWGWTSSQESITEWCSLVIDDGVLNHQIPDGWSVVLWSDIEKKHGVNYKEVLSEINQPRHSLLIHQHLEYMKMFPSKKLVGDIRIAATQRVAQYVLQGLVFEKEFLKSAILLQTETPWDVKDPLYQPLRKAPLPIIHPFEERR